jgi:Protein of unknown function (DUF3775)
VREELVDFFGSMNEDEQRELIALYLIGGVDFPVEDRPGALAEVAHRGPWTAAFLLGMPKCRRSIRAGIGDLRIFPRGLPPLTGRGFLERAAAGLQTRYSITGSRIC